MHDGLQYDPIQVQGYKPFKVGNPAIFKSSFAICNGNWPLATDSYRAQYLNLIGPDV